MTKNIKRTIIEIAVVVAILIIGYFVLNSFSTKAYVMEGRAKALQEKYDTDKAAWEKEKEGIDTEFNAKLKDVTRVADEMVAKAKVEKEAIEEKYEESLEMIAEADDDEIVRELNKVVGQEFTLTNSGFFLSTRKGAELTLAVFKDRDKYKALYETELETTAGLRKEMEDFKVSVKKSWDENNASWAKRLTDCETVQTNCANALKVSKRARTASLFKGAGGGVLLVVAAIAVKSLLD